MKILCGTDFSERARAAGRVAVDLARLTSGSIELVHVIGPPAGDVLALSTDARTIEAGIREDATTRLEAERQALARGEVPVTASVVEGDVDAAVLARAAALGADLIAIGGTNRSALGRLVLGSGADRIIRRTDRPVIVVPEGVAALGGKAGAHPLHVVVSLDGRPESEGALALTRALRQRVACDVTFLRLYWPIEEYTRLGLTGPRDLAGPDPVVVEDLQRTMARQVGVLPGGGRTAHLVEATWGEPASRLLEVARDQKADLLVLGTESRRGLGRVAHPPVAERVARHATGVPVVFVPPGPKREAAATVPAIFTVLAPTDLSETGNRAVPFAYAMLAGHGGVVELCHVHERVLASPPYAYEQPQGKLTPAERERLTNALRSLIPPEAERLGITTHVSVIDGGHVATVIRQTAERLSVDAVVLGSHGRGSAYRAFMGSISEAVVQQTRRPVLVIPPAKTGT
jgi:nucleotide-binding universal stress UspA family protein